MKKFYAAIFIVLITAVTLSSLVIHPFGRVKAVHSQKPLFQGVQIETPVLQILERSCQNCHSEQTSWPWYSYVAPTSWLVEKDVRDARTHFNMSRWDEYTLQNRAKFFAEISYMVRNREMPLPRYLFLHPEAKLTDQDVELIDRWGQSERKRAKMDEDKQKPGNSQVTAP